MLVAVTGTPGVGKTTICNELGKEFNVISVNDFARENGCFGDFDEKAGSYDVDTDMLSGLLQRYRDGRTVLDGHLSHHVECDAIIVLRCAPKLLAERLTARGYSEEKVRENVQAEIIDVILSESAWSNPNTYEIDCTQLSTKEATDAVRGIINKKDVESFMPGSVDWTEEAEGWF